MTDLIVYIVPDDIPGYSKTEADKSFYEVFCTSIVDYSSANTLVEVIDAIDSFEPIFLERYAGMWAYKVTERQPALELRAVFIFED